MKFEDSTADDRRMRQRVLSTLLAVDKAIQGRHVQEFEVVRTVNRKGYRYEQGFNAKGQYAGDPKTLVKVIIEVPDDVRPEFKTLVADITKIEADGIHVAKEAKVAAAQARADQALAEVERLKQELDDTDMAEEEGAEE